MKAEQELEKDALAAEQVPTVYTDLNAIAIEAEKPCRTQSALAFLGPNGIFTGVTKSSVSVIILGQRVEIIRFNLALNPVHTLNPNVAPPNCNTDGVTFVPAQSTNVLAVAEPQYIRNNKKVTNVVLFFRRTNKAKPTTLGIRVKFEENAYQTGQFNPKRKTGQISFP